MVVVEMDMAEVDVVVEVEVAKPKLQYKNDVKNHSMKGTLPWPRVDVYMYMA